MLSLLPPFEKLYQESEEQNKTKEVLNSVKEKLICFGYTAGCCWHSQSSDSSYDSTFFPTALPKEKTTLPADLWYSRDPPEKQLLPGKLLFDCIPPCWCQLSMWQTDSSGGKASELPWEVDSTERYLVREYDS